MAIATRYEHPVDVSNEGFEFQTYRAIVHASVIQEKYVVVRGMSMSFVRDDSVLMKAIDPEHVEGPQLRQCHAFDEFLEDLLSTPIGFPRALGNGFEFPFDSDNPRTE